MTRAWTPSNGVRSRSPPLSRSTTCRCQFSSPPAVLGVDDVAVVLAPQEAAHAALAIVRDGRGVVAAERAPPTRSGRRRPGRCGPAAGRPATPPAPGAPGFRTARRAGSDRPLRGDCIQAPPSSSLHSARMDARPIGMFDSGVGGLTVLHECLVSLPHEDFVYFGDSSPDRFPYGPKPAATIRRFAHEIATHLAALDTKLVIVACNAATSAALPEPAARVRRAADRRDHPRGARGRAGHAQPPRRRDGDPGDGAQRPLSGRRARCWTPASR